MVVIIFQMGAKLCRRWLDCGFLKYKCGPEQTTIMNNHRLGKYGCHNTRDEFYHIQCSFLNYLKLFTWDKSALVTNTTIRLAIGKQSVTRLPIARDCVRTDCVMRKCLPEQQHSLIQ